MAFAEQSTFASASTSRQLLRKPPQIAYPSSGARAVSNFQVPGKDAPYIVHCRSLPASSAGGGAPRVVAYSDDGLLRVVDKSSGSTAWQSSQALKSGSVTDLKVSGSGWVASGDAGVVELWDERSAASGSSRTLKGPNGAPYLSVAAQVAGDAHIVAAGCEISSGDANIDIWDTRSPGAPLFTYSESHSDDVTALAFSPAHPSILLSGSSDGLVASYDLSIGAEEDDAVIAVGNTGASLAKIGWGGAKPGIGSLFVKPGEQDDKLDGEDAEQPRRGIGCAWAVSDMQTLSIWDADRFDQVLEPYDTRQQYSSKPPWESDYIIDAYDVHQAGIPNLEEGVVLFMGDQAGGVAIIHAPSQAGPGAQSPSWSLLGLLPSASSGPRSKCHSDIVRCLDLDTATRTVTTGGEDGRLCVWSLDGVQVDPETIGPSFAPAMMLADGSDPSDPSNGGSRDRNSPLGAAGKHRFKPYA